MTDRDSEGRAATGFVAVASVLVVVSSFVGGSLAEWTLALSAVWIPVALIALAAGTKLRRLRASLIGLAVMMGLAAAGVLLLPTGAAAGARLSGLPLATLVMLAGLGLGPLALVLWSYTATFDERGHDS